MLMKARHYSKGCAKMNRYIFDPVFALVGIFSSVILTSLDIFAGIAPRWLVPGVFAICLLSLMTMEIITSYLSTSKLLRAHFDWEQHVGSKLLLIALVIVSAILDGMLLLVITYYPTGPQSFPPWAKGFMPVTISTLVWLGLAEAGRSIIHIAKGTDVSNISPVVLWVIRQLRKVDMMRLPTGESGQKRLLDNVTEDDITTLLKELKSRQNLEQPPPPLAKGSPPIASDMPPVTDANNSAVKESIP